MQDHGGIRRNSKELKQLNETLHLSRRDTFEEHDYRTDQHRAESLHLKPKMAINSDTDSSDSDDDEAMKVAKHALYAKEYMRSHSKYEGASDLESEDY